MTNMTFSYKNTKLNVRFVTEELGFESYQEAAQFILDNGESEYLEEIEDGLFINCSKASAQFRAAADAALATVDIKGQI
jgi:hypothetical protein